MSTITIPNDISNKDDLVVLPKKVFETMQARMMPILNVRGKATLRVDARVREGERMYRQGKTEPFAEFLRREYPDLRALYAD